MGRIWFKFQHPKYQNGQCRKCLKTWTFNSEKDDEQHNGHKLRTQLMWSQCHELVEAPQKKLETWSHASGAWNFQTKLETSQFGNS
jgi:hypothetical protein